MRADQPPNPLDKKPLNQFALTWEAFEAEAERVDIPHLRQIIRIDMTAEDLESILSVSPFSIDPEDIPLLIKISKDPNRRMKDGDKELGAALDFSVIKRVIFAFLVHKMTEARIKEPVVQSLKKVGEFFVGAEIDDPESGKSYYTLCKEQYATLYSGAKSINQLDRLNEVGNWVYDYLDIYVLKAYIRRCEKEIKEGVMGEEEARYTSECINNVRVAILRIEQMFRKT